MKERILAERDALLKQVIAANKDLDVRTRQLGVTFLWDEASDSFGILVGHGNREETYTQNANNIEVDLDITTDKVVCITVHSFAQSFIKTNAGLGFADLLHVLREYGPAICIPPESHGTERAASQLRSLVPVFA